MRILWVGNSPWSPSGYGNQASLFIPRFQQAGHEMAIACNWGLQGSALEWNGINCYPADGVWQNRTIRTYIDHHKADLTIALCDAWVLTPEAWQEGTRLAVWAPIDHYPIPPKVLAVLAHEMISPIAMTRNGETLMQEAKLNPVYVPHGVDTNLFRPYPKDVRERARAGLGLPQDAFLVGMVAANKSHPAVARKSFPQAFMAFSRFAKEHENAWMYVHSQAKQDPHGAGIDLDDLANIVGCPQGKIRFPHDNAWDIGMDSEHLAVLYQAFDVLLNPSMGEGFGIPLVEAQACGVPVIASDHSAMTELTHAGWLVTGDPWYDHGGQSFFIVPAIDSIHAALEAAYEQRNNQDIREAAVAFAQGYDADLVMEKYWQPALEKLLGDRLPTLREIRSNGMNRQARRKLARSKR